MLLFRKMMDSKIAIGQVATAGITTSFTIPNGVKFISAVCIGAGGRRLGSAGDPTIGAGGGGGALAYRNNIPVTPGELIWFRAVNNPGDGTILSSEIRRGSSTGTLLLHAGNGQDGQNGTVGALTAAGGVATAVSGAVSFAGGPGRRWNATIQGGGGGSGYYDSIGPDGDATGADGVGASRLGPYAGTSYGSGQGGASTSFIARNFGAVRIIWPGNLRRYPNTRTLDE